LDAGKRTVRDIFNRGRNLEIPFFQRSYVWKDPQWQRFLEDMEIVSDTKQSYFLGSVILKQKRYDIRQRFRLGSNRWTAKINYIKYIFKSIVFKK
jgi:hypothetical protein